MLKKLNDAMDYIEHHLQEDFLLENVSRHIHVSDCHFRKIFWALTNMTLGEYIKNRRLSEANRALLNGASVTDVAYQYGYQSIDGFTRAFKKWAGILPSQAASLKQGRMVQKLQFVISVKGGTSMKYQIVEKPAFFIAGVSKRVPLQFQGINQEIVRLAQSITEDQRKEMHRIQNVEPHQIVNASYESDTGFLEESGELTHMIGVLTTQTNAGCGLEYLPVQAHTWAIFQNEGAFPSALQDTMARIYSEWLPSSDYELAESLTFSFVNMDKSREDYANSEIWIPVRKRSEAAQ